MDKVSKRETLYHLGVGWGMCSSDSKVFRLLVLPLILFVLTTPALIWDPPPPHPTACPDITKLLVRGMKISHHLE